ncbi:DNA-directed DNA polymerase [Tanacetum coccineum]
MNERCSAVLLNKLPSKENGPGSFTISCDIGDLHINNALADLGASISLMPYSMYEKLGLGEPKHTRMSLELADRPPAKDDECYGIDDLDKTIHIEAQELLENDQIDSFLLNNLEKCINQSDLESSVEGKIVNDSKSIRRIEQINTPYYESHETWKAERMQNEHLYSASANEIDKKKPKLK